MKISPILSINISCRNIKPTLKTALIGVAALASPLTISSAKVLMKANLSDSYKNIKPKTLKPLISEENNPLKFMSNLLSKEVEGTKIIKFLTENRSEYQKLLNINKQDYQIYEKAIKKIAAPSKKTLKLDDTVNEFSETYGYNNIEDDIYVAKTTYMMYKNSYKDLFNPLNPERLRLYRVSDSEKEELKNCKINYKNDSLTANELIIGALVRLKTLDKKYSNYVETMSEIKPDLNDKNIKKSVINAKMIMSNDILSDEAISNFKLGWMNHALFAGEFKPVDTTLNENDMNDLRIFAKTITLDRDDFLVEMWNKNPIIPIGKKSDRAIANILSIYKNNLQ